MYPTNFYTKHTNYQVHSNSFINKGNTLIPTYTAELTHCSYIPGMQYLHESQCHAYYPNYYMNFGAILLPRDINAPYEFLYKTQSYSRCTYVSLLPG